MRNVAEESLIVVCLSKVCIARAINTNSKRFESLAVASRPLQLDSARNDKEPTLINPSGGVCASKRNDTRDQEYRRTQDRYRAAPHEPGRSISQNESSGAIPEAIRQSGTSRDKNRPQVFRAKLRLVTRESNGRENVKSAGRSRSGHRLPLPLDSVNLRFVKRLR